MVFGAVAAACVAIQSILIGRTLDMSERALEVTQRAYVNVQSVKFSLPFKIGKLSNAVVEYRNSGLTPARELWVAPESGFSDTRMPPRVEQLRKGPSTWCETIPSGEVLPPQVTRHKNTDLAKSGGAQIPPDFQINITQDEFKGVEAGTKWYYIAVDITYRDQFGHCHYTEEPFRFNPKPMSLTP